MNLDQIIEYVQSPDCDQRRVKALDWLYRLKALVDSRTIEAVLESMPMASNERKAAELKRQLRLK